MEEKLLQVFNKLNDVHYINGIVNLSNYTLTHTDITVLLKGLGFCPTPGASDIGNTIHDLDVFKRKTRLHLFFSEYNQDSSERITQSGIPFEHKSFKLKFSLNPVRTFLIRNHVPLH